MRVVPWIAVVVAAGCTTSPRYALVRSDLPCARAVRVTHRTLVGLGFTINEMAEPGESGVGWVGGTKTDANGRVVNGRVQIRCDRSGVTLQPVESDFLSQFEFSRAFDYSF